MPIFRAISRAVYERVRTLPGKANAGRKGWLFLHRNGKYYIRDHCGNEAIYHNDQDDNMNENIE